MSINKIKLKQIDADFSGLVGEYGSGYFASTGSFNSLSGSAFKYSDVSNYRFVYQTGAQNISGVKNFFSRPNLSGQGLARLNEVVTLSDAQTINGQKTFQAAAVNFSENEINYEFNNVNFTETDFLFDDTSSNNLSLALGNRVVNTSSNQTVAGIKNFTSGIRINGTGVLLSGNPFPVFVSGANSSIVRHLTFVENNSEGFKNLQINTGLLYSTLSQSLRCGTFSGNLSGNALSANSASLATTATRLSGKTPIATINGSGFDGSSDIVIRPSGREDASNENRFLLFTSGNAAGYKDVFFDSNITVNPSANSISASAFIGGFSGSALNSSAGSLSLGTLAGTDFINFQFPANTTAYQLTNTFFAPINSGTRALGQASRAWSTVFASTTTIQTSDFNLKTEISEIPDAWLDAWEEVNYVRYKFKDAVALKGLSEARWHVGHIAQDIHEKFQNRGLNAFEIGMLCYDEWQEYTDANGNIVPSGQIWSIRADECQFMEMALTRRTINRLKSGILNQ
jgi:hypothetical protein